MPRYYFNMVEGEHRNLVRDSEGTLLDGVRAARTEALGLARDVVRHGLDGLTRTWKVVVTDEWGHEILTVPLSEIRISKLHTLADLVHRIVQRLPGATPRAFLLLLLLLLPVLATAVTIGRYMEQSGSFRTASAPAEGAVVAVRFTMQASAADITDLLLAYNASLVGGPRPGGLYRVRVSGTAMPPEELHALAGRMARESAVEFAAAVQ